MVSGHTPGPWSVDTTKITLAIRSTAAKGGERYRVASLGIGRRTPDAVDVANARLIAAAPDLLAACKALLGPEVIASLRGEEKFDPVGMAFAAIAKAEGK